MTLKNTPFERGSRSISSGDIGLICFLGDPWGGVSVWYSRNMTFQVLQSRSLKITRIDRVG